MDRHNTILIDGRPFVAPSAGITNFLKGSLKAWAAQRPDDTFIVALPHNQHTTLDLGDIPQNIRLLRYTNAVLRRLPNLVWLCAVMPLLACRLKVTAYYSALPCLPFFLPRRLKTIIVVHDVVNLEYKETMQWTNRLSNALFFKRSVRQADILWTNSLYTKAKVEQYFPQRRCRQIFSGCAIDRNTYHPLSLTAEEKVTVREQHGIKGSFVLFVGSLEPRKNLSFLLSLMPRLYKEYHLQLVVVGGRGWKNSTIAKVVDAADFPKESTVFCGFVGNAELSQLYNTADCFVSASLNEGFGMPQLEALCCGCPVVTARNSAMTEVADGKDGAITIEGYDPETWVSTIVRIATEHPHVNTTQLADYDWAVILKRLITILYEDSH